jgi:hypothetical protein
MPSRDDGILRIATGATFKKQSEKPIGISRSFGKRNKGKNWKIYTHPSLLIQCVKNFLVYEFTWSFEPYVEFVPYSTRVLGSKGRAVGWGIGPLPYPSLVRLLLIIGRPRPGTSALDTLTAREVCRDLVRLTLCGRTHF